jgi:anti-sigma-K factor RskA
LNTREYIESGIIEQFVMGETSEQETQEVMAYARQYPEIKAEIEAVENALINLADQNSYEPLESTRIELMEELFGKSKSLPVMETSENSGSPIISIQQPMSKQVAFNKKYLVAASVALIASTVLNISLFNKLKTSENALMAMHQEKQEFATILASEKTNYLALQEQMNMINSSNVIQVKLNGMKLIPDAKAIIYYDTLSKDVYLSVNKLPAAPENHQYQLWAIVGGKPVDAGVFDADGVDAAMRKMKTSDKPAAFAVTIEKKGGSVNPTLEQMVLLGNFPS